MPRSLIYKVGTFAACLATIATVSCAKLESGDKLVGPLAFKPAGAANTIPDEYGTLVGVTQPAPQWSALWFQKQDKTIVVVFVNVEEGTMSSRGLTIPRK